MLIHYIESIQALFDGNLSKLKEGDQALVEGEVVEYTQSKSELSDYGLCSVKMNTGEVVQIILWNGYLTFEGGVIEVLDPPNPIIGDKIQVNCTFGNPGKRYDKNEETGLYAYYCRSTYLLTPSVERSQELDESTTLFLKLMDGMDEYKDDNLSIVRALYSRIIRESIVKENNQLALTKAQQNELKSKLETIFKGNPGEMPLELFDDIYVAQEINKVYSCNIFSMSRNKYLEFVKTIAKGERRFVIPGSVDYIYRLLRSNFSPEECQEVLLLAVKKLNKEVSGKKTIFSKSEVDGQGRTIGKFYDELPDDIDSIAWETRYLFTQSLSYLSGYASVDIARQYISLVKDMYDNNMFRTPQDREENREYSEFEIFYSMERNINKCLEIDWEKGEILKIVHPGILREYFKEIPLLRLLVEKLKLESWNNDERYKVWEYLEKCIYLLESAKDFQMKDNAKWN